MMQLNVNTICAACDGCDAEIIASANAPAHASALSAPLLRDSSADSAARALFMCSPWKIGSGQQHERCHVNHARARSNLAASPFAIGRSADRHYVAATPARRQIVTTKASTSGSARRDLALNQAHESWP